MNSKTKIRNVSLILLGTLILMVKHNYNGPGWEIVRSYAGNFSISFAIYFLIDLNSLYWKGNKLITAVIALLIVELFEITNGFGVMLNVYDTIDLLVNAAGMVLALTVDRLLDVKNSKENLEEKATR